MGLEFPRSARLTRSGAFREVRERGRSYRARHMTLGVLPCPTPGTPSQFGIITTKRLGNAPERNKTRRRFREILRHHRHAIVPGHWIVVVARGAAAHADYHTIEDELLRLCRKASILLPAS